MAALAAAIITSVAWLLFGPGGRPLMAAGPDSPIMVVHDERDAGAKEAEPAIYVLWPGQRKVEAYSSRTCSFTSYDFAAKKVISRSADIDFQ